MIDPCGEVELSWFERIISWEVDVQEVYSSGVWRVIWSHDGGLPMILVLLVNWSGGAVGWWILFKIDEFLFDSFDARHMYDFFFTFSPNQIFPADYS